MFLRSKRVIPIFEPCSGIKKHRQITLNFINYFQKEKQVDVGLDLDFDLKILVQQFLFHYYIHLRTGLSELIILISIIIFFTLYQDKYSRINYLPTQFRYLKSWTLTFRKSCFHFFQEKLFKNDEECFLFHFKSFFRS